MFSYFLLLFVKFFCPTSASWISSYAADLLAIPLILYCAEKVVLWLYGSKKQIRTIHQLAGTCYVIIMFELALPLISDKYTADGFDILCYVIGFFLHVGTRKLLVSVE